MFQGIKNLLSNQKQYKSSITGITNERKEAEAKVNNWETNQHQTCSPSFEIPDVLPTKRSLQKELLKSSSHEAIYFISSHFLAH